MTRLLASALVVMATVFAVHHDHDEHEVHDHHHDETPIHAGGACILCACCVGGDGDLDAVFQTEIGLSRPVAVDRFAPSTFDADWKTTQYFVRVRGPPFGS
ncbi:MAG: hypothetical protein AAF225_11000 [Pseudomonadota bacterium]